MIYSTIGIIVCLIFSALFSSIETAFTSLTIFQIEELKKRGKRGQLVEKLVQNPDRLISTILIGNNVVNILASSLSTQLALELFGDAGISIATGVLTFVVLIFGEVTPKRIALQKNESIALNLSPFIQFFEWILKPFVWIVNIFSSIITNLIGEKTNKEMSIESVVQMMSTAEHLGIIDYAKSRMVKNVFRLGATTVQAIMTHRMNVYSFPVEMSVEEACNKTNDNSYSVIPVYKGETENIIGLVSLREIVAEAMAGHKDKKLSELMREPIFILPNKPIEDVFTLFKRNKETFAVVIDEYGGLAGVVTMDDIIGEIIGAVDKDSENLSEDHLIKQDENEYLVAGDAPLILLSELSTGELPNMPYVQTVAGYIAWALDRIPVPGDKAETELGTFKVLSVDTNRVKSAKYYPTRQD